MLDSAGDIGISLVIIGKIGNNEQFPWAGYARFDDTLIQKSFDFESYFLPPDHYFLKILIFFGTYIK